MASAVDLFGSTSEGGARLEEWLAAMCRGCRHESVRDRNAGIGGGSQCGLVDRAMGDPYEADMPEWSRDAAYPPHCAEQFGDGQPWPVCLSYAPRARRRDAGVKRGPRVPAGQDRLL